MGDKRVDAHSRGSMKAGFRFYSGPYTTLPLQPSGANPLIRVCTGPPRTAGLMLPRLVSQPVEADLFALPRVWGAYRWRSRMHEAAELAELARVWCKPLLVWHTGDLNPIVPFQHAIVFQQGLERSRTYSNRFLAPAFIEDPAMTVSSGEAVVRKKSPKPTVGFCGYGAAHPLKLAYSLASNLAFAVRYRLGRSYYEPPPLVPATVLRARVLNSLALSPHVETKFIVRRRYRAGHRERRSGQDTVREFFENIYGTDYTLCVRGYGNWSLRFYETLACGRIPIFVDTDSRLPFDNLIDWTRYCVWVPAEEVERAGEFVADFHSRLSERDFQELQRACRHLWLDRLSMEGFVAHMHELI